MSVCERMGQPWAVPVVMAQVTREYLAVWCSAVYPLHHCLSLVVFVDGLAVS